MNYKDFAKLYKEKYPVYADRDDRALAEAVLRKYPVYADRVEFDDPSVIGQALSNVMTPFTKPIDAAAQVSQWPVLPEGVSTTSALGALGKEAVRGGLGLLADWATLNALLQMSCLKIL
jgi:hypothetical protein